MRINKLTFLAFYLNGAQGSGKYDHISIQQVKNEVDKGTIFSFLEQELGNDIDLSLYSEEEKAELAAEWLDYLLAVNEKRKFAVEKGGLCLLIAYLLQGIQNRAK